MITAKNFRKVNNNLYRGGLPSVSDIQELKNFGVNTIIDFNRHIHPREKKACDYYHIKYIHKPWTAGFHHFILWNYYWNIAEDFLGYVRNERLFPLYIHCYRGRDRTGMLIALYRMVYEGWDYKAAVKEMYEFGFNPVMHFDLLVFLMLYRGRAKSKPVKSG